MLTRGVEYSLSPELGFLPLPPSSLGCAADGNGGCSGGRGGCRCGGVLVRGGCGAAAGVNEEVRRGG